MDVIELLRATEAAYQEADAKLKAREAAAAAHDAAHQAYVVASDKLTALQQSLSAVIGKVAPAANPRVRIG
jgi:phage-related minor tail protein